MNTIAHNMHFDCSSVLSQSQPEEPTPAETPPDEVKEPVVDHESEPYPDDDISEEEDEDDDDEDDYHEDDDKVRVCITQKTWASINFSDV